MEKVDIPKSPAPAASRCAICQWPLEAQQAKTICPACSAAYHSDCWNDNRGCAVYGCSKVPETEHREAVEVPVSYWGQENKPCPSCGQVILAAAVRCRHCGATFSSARPEGKGEYKHRVTQEKSQPALQRQTVWLFVFAAIPCTAPAAALFGWIWYRNHRQDLKVLPALHAALAKVAVGIAFCQTFFMAAMVVLFAMFRGS